MTPEEIVIQLRAERDALLDFKNYVHKRLDEAGIPTHPEGPHSQHGCRIGDRLDIALTSHKGLRFLESLFDYDYSTKDVCLRWDWCHDYWSLEHRNNDDYVDSYQSDGETESLAVFLSSFQSAPSADKQTSSSNPASPRPRG